MTQRVITLDPAEFDSLLIQFKPREPEHIKGELGIDVSRHQGIVNWDGMLVAGVAFAGIRATMGTIGHDDKFALNWSEARRVGIQRMAYHYFVNNIPGVAQAANLLATLGSDLGELPMVVDVEPTTGQIIADKTSNTREILACLQEIERRTDVRPTVYCNGWSWGACTTVPDWSSSYALWVAAYTTAPAPRIPAPWTTAQIWQYSASGSIAGTSPLDLNRYGPY